MNIMHLPDGDEKDSYDMRIGALCLFGNGLTSAYNLLGVCILAIAEVIWVFAFYESQKTVHFILPFHKATQKLIFVRYLAQTD